MSDAITRRYKLQKVLEAICPDVYFQPPETTRLIYPCILYNWDFSDVMFADNVQYVSTRRYSVTVIDKNPDSFIPIELGKMQMCMFDRFYTEDNLNHWVFDLYF